MTEHAMSNAALANPSVRTIWTYALFASNLQPSDKPTRDQIRTTIAVVLRKNGSCAETVASEYGHHPETAALRMGWCRTCVDAVVAAEAGTS